MWKNWAKTTTKQEEWVAEYETYVLNKANFSEKVDGETKDELVLRRLATISLFRDAKTIVQEMKGVKTFKESVVLFAKYKQAKDALYKFKVALDYEYNERIVTTNLIAHKIADDQDHKDYLKDAKKELVAINLSIAKLLFKSQEEIDYQKRWKTFLEKDYKTWVRVADTVQIVKPTAETEQEFKKRVSKETESIKLLNSMKEDMRNFAASENIEEKQKKYIAEKNRAKQFNTDINELYQRRSELQQEIKQYTSKDTLQLKTRLSPKENADFMVSREKLKLVNIEISDLIDA